MELLADIVKNLRISKILISAVFITSLVMCFGPGVAPTIVPKFKSEFLPYIFAVMVLTGFVLLVWVLDFLWCPISRSLLSAKRRAFTNSNLSNLEIDVLSLIAKDPTKATNLDYVTSKDIEISKLELIDYAKQLQDKVLVSIDSVYNNIVSVTDLGRKRALEIQKKK